MYYDLRLVIRRVILLALFGVSHIERTRVKEQTSKGSKLQGCRRGGEGEKERERERKKERRRDAERTVAPLDTRSGVSDICAVCGAKCGACEASATGAHVVLSHRMKYTLNLITQKNVRRLIFSQGTCIYRNGKAPVLENHPSSPCLGEKGGASLR